MVNFESTIVSLKATWIECVQLAVSVNSADKWCHLVKKMFKVTNREILSQNQMSLRTFLSPSSNFYSQILKC